MQFSFSSSLAPDTVIINGSLQVGFRDQDFICNQTADVPTRLPTPMRVTVLYFPNGGAVCFAFDVAYDTA